VRVARHLCAQVALLRPHVCSCWAALLASEPLQRATPTSTPAHAQRRGRAAIRSKSSPRSSRMSIGSEPWTEIPGRTEIPGDVGGACHSAADGAGARGEWGSCATAEARARGECGRDHEAGPLGFWHGCRPRHRSMGAPTRRWSCSGATAELRRSGQGARPHAGDRPRRAARTARERHRSLQTTLKSCVVTWTYL